jgi:hypothetical protein
MVAETERDFLASHQLESAAEKDFLAGQLLGCEEVKDPTSGDFTGAKAEKGSCTRVKSSPISGLILEAPFTSMYNEVRIFNGSFYHKI